MDYKNEAQKLIDSFHELSKQMEYGTAKQCALIDIQNRIDLIDELYDTCSDSSIGALSRKQESLSKIKSELEKL